MKLPDVKLPERKQTVKLLDKSIAIPAYYEKLDEIPFDPYGSEYSIAYGARSSNALCALVFTPTPLEDAMPYNDVQYLLDYCRNNLSEKQGLIEIDTGRTKGGYRYIYSIVKSDANDDEEYPFAIMVYTLNMNIDYRDFTLSLVGNFQEDGTTGIRDNMGMMLIARTLDKNPSEIMGDGWFRDPYDADYKKGFLMNMSEGRMFDGMFPEHPLSMLRELIAYVAENN